MLIEREVAAAIMRSAERSSTGSPRVLLYAPRAEGNPFQALLYGSLWERGVTPVPCSSLSGLRAAEIAISAGGRAAVHVHWTSSLHAPTIAEFRQRTTRFLTMLDDLRSIGVPIVWTVHNPVEHDSPFPTDELSFRAELAQRADLVHVMSDAAVDFLATTFPLDRERVEVIPHPSYVGVYPDHLNRAAARSQFGLSDSDVVIGVVGGLRPYKRIAHTQRACDKATSESRRVRLLCAGELAQHPAMADEMAPVLQNPWSVVIPRSLNDRVMSAAVAACDVISCVYDSPLVSGVSMLAMSLGRPVLLPDRAASRELAGDAGIYVDPGDADALADAITQLDLADVQRRGVLARRQAEALRHDKIAARFAEVVDGLV